MNTKDQIRSAAAQGLTRNEVIATVLGGRAMTDDERIAFDRARGIWKLKEQKRKAEKRAGYKYESASERASRSAAKRKSEAADIGDIPAPRHATWRAHAAVDPVFFVTIYCRSVGGARFLKWRPDAEAVAYIRAVASAIISSGRVHVRFPRGAGKTSLCKGVILWAILFGYRKYIFIGAANSDNAKGIMNDLWDIIEFSPRLLADFPEACIPIRRLEGRMQRCAAQHQHGEPTRIESAADGFTMPTTKMANGEKAPCSGCVLVSRGWTAGVRGLVRGSQRPDFALIDDPQKQKGASSEAECESIESWVQGDVAGLAGRDRAISMVMTTTPIQDGDVSERFADRNLHPEWKTITIPLVLSWSTHPELWEQYFAIRAEDEFKDGDKLTRATAFYTEHRAEMDDGVVVIDRRAYDRSIQLSAVQAAYDLKFTSRGAFDAEYQLKPTRNNTIYNLTPSNVFAHIAKGVKPYEYPEGFKPVLVTCATDINRATAGLTWCMKAYDEQMTSHVMAYGIYRTSITNDIARVERDRMTYAALVDHHRQITKIAQRLGVDFSCGVDASGEAYDVVHRLAANSLSLGIVRPWPMTGQSGENWNPNRRAGVVGRPRNYTMELVDRDGRHRIAFLADYHREGSQTQWLGEVGAPSTCTIFDGNHADFAKQVCAERLVAKDIKKGVTYWVWRASKNVPHDFGDASSYCDVLAAFRGLNGCGGTVQAKSKKNKRKVYAG